ncbi:MAG: amidohydrolase, partial [Deltaproteobacteria bacterium]
MTFTGSLALHFLMAAACTATSPGGNTGNKMADKIIVAGRIITMDSDRPEARAIAITGDTIMAVGTEKEISALGGDDTVWIRLDKATVLPGFIDSHGHFIGLG